MTSEHYKNTLAPAWSMAGMFTLSLRLVAGWTYFSAFWRRLILENKLDPDEAGYIGEKFNHFLPNALGIKPLIEYLVSHPQELWWAMAVFTIIEGIVGLLFMLGLFTRLMSAGVFMLAMGILLGSGWIGTTCLDEWQIGVLGIAAGFSTYLSGGGTWSLDNYLSSRTSKLTGKSLAWIASGPLAIGAQTLKKLTLAGSLLILLLTLYTNQVFHGGVWGTLHNKSVKPKIEIADAAIREGKLSFSVYRIEGADVYGSYLIGISLRDAAGATLLELDGNALASLRAEDIKNRYVAKVKPGKHSLIIPLGSKAQLSLAHEALRELRQGEYVLTLTDISGLTWSSRITL